MRSRLSAGSGTPPWTASRRCGNSLLSERHDPKTGERRFLLLETVAEYAAELLATAADLDIIRAHHASYVLGIVLEADAGAFVSTHRSWLQRLRAEQDDIRAALHWNIETPERQATALRLISVLWRFWELTGAASEGDDWCTRVLAITSDQDSALVGRGLNAAGAMAWQLRDPERALDLVTRSLELQRAVQTSPASQGPCCGSETPFSRRIDSATASVSAGNRCRSAAALKTSTLSLPTSAPSVGARCFRGDSAKPSTTTWSASS